MYLQIDFLSCFIYLCLYFVNYSMTSPNALTTLICTVSPSRESTFETSSTLALASQAVHINSKADKVLQERKKERKRREGEKKD